MVAQQATVQAGGPPAACDAPPPLDDTERGQVNLARRFGTVGSVLAACGALGAGAAPVFNPVPDLPVLGVFSRLPSVALACVYAGIGMVVLAWLWLGRFARPGRERMATRGQIHRTMLLWAVPLAVAPPMFSTDVYSYLAQSKIFALGMNPYEMGPAQALGTGDLLTRNVPNVWRDTPAPYGPGFLTVGRSIAWATGDDVVAGALLHRALELAGLALIVWALPRLARRFGVQPVSALWLGAANPLVMCHLISGSHNEALMIGCMLGGFEIALARTPPVPRPGEPVPPLTAPEVCFFLAGSVLIAVGSSVKFTALAGLGFLGVHMARRLGGSWSRLGGVACACAAVAAAVLTGFSMVGGLGFGWVSAATTPGLIKTFLAPMTDLGNVGGKAAVLLGLGDQTGSAIEVLRMLGNVAAVLVVLKLLHSAFVGRIRPMVGLGLGLAGVIFFGAAVQPWYLLWAALPLATGVGYSKFRTWAALISATVALLTPPTGAGFGGRGYVVPEAAALAVVTVGLLAYAVHRRIPVFGELHPRLLLRRLRGGL